MSSHENLASPGQGGEPGREDVSGDVDVIAAERVVFFSDAVVAIAITLLALDLYVPKDLSSTSAILHDARIHYLNYLGFLISFLVIARHWRSHHRLFADVTKLTSHVISVNFLWLLMIVITPFATRVLVLPGNSFKVGFSFYAAVQVLILLSFLVLMRQLRAGGLHREPAAEGATADDELGLIMAAAMFTISIPLGWLIHDWAFAFWAASPYLTKIIRYSRSRA